MKRFFFSLFIGLAVISGSGNGVLLVKLREQRERAVAAEKQAAEHNSQIGDLERRLQEQEQKYDSLLTSATEEGERLRRALQQANASHGERNRALMQMVHELRAELDVAQRDLSVNERRRQAAEVERERVAAARQANLQSARDDATRESQAGAVSAARMPANLDEVVLRRVRRYYEAQRTNGSGHSLVFEVNADIEERRQVPGWSGRYEVSGVAWFQYYDSVWGGSFSRHSGQWTATVEMSGGAARVVDLQAR